MNNFDSDFIDSIKTDVIVQNYTTQSSTIHATIINTIDNAIAPKLDNVGILPMLVNVGECFFDIIYHFTPDESNAITQMMSKSKAIIGLADMVQPIEGRHLQKSVVKGKNPKFDHFFGFKIIADVLPKC